MKKEQVRDAFHFRARGRLYDHMSAAEYIKTSVEIMLEILGDAVEQATEPSSTPQDTKEG